MHKRLAGARLEARLVVLRAVLPRARPAVQVVLALAAPAPAARGPLTRGPLTRGPAIEGAATAGVR